VAERVDDFLSHQDVVRRHDIIDQRLAGRLLARQPRN
jgi:hypothetical protein